ncbi:MAG TPA: hypothetical protein VJA27_02755 [Patescibacteria group bacterium]|nr:hypothetical protein [Patescibacteria group bacterium]
MQKKFLILLSVVVVVSAAFLLFNSLSPRSMSTEAFCTGPLSECVGKKVKLVGELTKEVQQGMDAPTGDFFNKEYFKIKGGGRIVIHSQAPMAVAERTPIEVIGVVTAVTGGGTPGEKLEVETTEYQLLVEEWKKVE